MCETERNLPRIRSFTVKDIRAKAGGERIGTSVIRDIPMKASAEGLECLLQAIPGRSPARGGTERLLQEMSGDLGLPRHRNSEQKGVFTMRLPQNSVLEHIYGETQESGARYASLASHYQELFGSDEMEFFSAPGRTEIVGNHTDHNGGKILAASISLDTIGAAYPNGTDTITIVSEGYEKHVVVNVKELSGVPKNRGTVSLVAGMAEAALQRGFQVSGFNAYVSTKVISAAGVSSSASFEMLVCSIINYFFNDGKMSYADYAKIGQYAENHFWDKASGLMDQMACAVGGPIRLDFSDDVKYEKVDFDFARFGYDMVIVNTGKGHADLSREYSEIPEEMKAVAKCLGGKWLADCSMEQLLVNYAKAEQELGNDRALLRAMHFFNENDRVERAVAAAERNDGRELLAALDESGRSSWELLQNCYAIANFKEQKVALALALTEQFLKAAGDGVCRIHGGGFAGVIVAIVPKAKTDEYVKYIAGFVGESNVYPMQIRAAGAVHVG